MYAGLHSPSPSLSFLAYTRNIFFSLRIWSICLSIVSRRSWGKQNRINKMSKSNRENIVFNSPGFSENFFLIHHVFWNIVFNTQGFSENFVVNLQCFLRILFLIHKDFLRIFLLIHNVF